MASREENRPEKRLTMAQMKQRKAEMVLRLSVAVLVPVLPMRNFTAFPQYMLSTCVLPEYIQGAHIGSVRPT